MDRGGCGDIGSGIDRLFWLTIMKRDEPWFLNWILAAVLSIGPVLAFVGPRTELEGISCSVTFGFVAYLFIQCLLFMVHAYLSGRFRGGTFHGGSGKPTPRGLRFLERCFMLGRRHRDTRVGKGG